MNQGAYRARAVIFGLFSILLLGILLPVTLSEALAVSRLTREGVVSSGRVVEVTSFSRTGKSTSVLLALEPPLSGTARLDVANMAGVEPGVEIDVVSIDDGAVIRARDTLDVSSMVIQIVMMAIGGASSGLFAFLNYRRSTRERYWQ